MKVAIATPYTPRYSETFIQAQMECLPCELRIHGGPIASETIPGGPIAPMQSFRGMVEMFYYRGLKGTGWAGPNSAELGRRMRRCGIDVVLANYGQFGGLLLPICQKLNLPVVIHFHGYDAHQYDVISSNKEIYHRIGSEASGVIVVSNFMAEAVEKLGIPPEKIHLVRYGGDPRRFSRKTFFPRKPLFFGAGRFVDKKAPYLTLLAFKKVHSRLPDSRLVLAGEGKLLETTRNLARSLGLVDVVSFPGVIEP